MLKEITNRGRKGVKEAAIVMAVSILTERISSLPKEDKKDLYELFKAMRDARSDEEMQAATLGVIEILEQEPSGVTAMKMDDPVTQVEKLEKWKVFVSGKIKQLREKAGMTQDELAEASDLPQSHICRLEQGQHSPSRKTLEKLAKALKVKLHEFDPSAE